MSDYAIAGAVAPIFTSVDDDTKSDVLSTAVFLAGFDPEVLTEDVILMGAGC